MIFCEMKMILSFTYVDSNRFQAVKLSIPLHRFYDRLLHLPQLLLVVPRIAGRYLRDGGRRQSCQINRGAYRHANYEPFPHGNLQPEAEDRVHALDLEFIQ